MLQSTLTSNIFLVSQMIFNRYPDNLLVQLIGVWEGRDGSGQLHAISGLAYYLSPPLTLTSALLDPIHTAIYFTFMLSACALFSKTWIEVSGASPREVAKQLKEQSMTIAGHREQSMYKELKRVIPTAAAFGGASIGALSAISDLIGALGSGYHLPRLDYSGLIFLVRVSFWPRLLFIRISKLLPRRERLGLRRWVIFLDEIEENRKER
jgi:protein transport protein SEC61 subunit alpha